MNTSQVKNEIRDTLGLFPKMFENIPDAILETEWKLFKRNELEENPIPNKYRELIGIAISGTTKCRYCAYFHTEMAKLFGATEEEIQNANQYAKHTAGWSTYINGMQLDYDTFKNEIDQIIEHAHAAHKEMA